MTNCHVGKLLTLNPKIMDTLNATLNGVKITSTFKVSFDADAKEAGKSHTVKVTYDFSDVDVKAMLEKTAVKTLNIKVQRILKDSFATADDMAKRINDKYSYDVEELLTPTKREYDPMTAGMKAAEKMTPEQFKDYIAAIEKMRKQSA